MVRNVQHVPRDYGVALSTPLLAFLLALLLAPSAKVWHYPLFMAAVIGSAFYGGRRSGLAALGLSAVILLFYHGILLSSRPPVPDLDFLFYLIAFTLLALL